MTLEEAYKILEQATNHPSLQLNRQSHIAVIQALEVIRDLIPTPDEPAADDGQ